MYFKPQIQEAQQISRLKRIIHTWNHQNETARNERFVSQLCLTSCDPIDCCTPGFPVLHCLLEFAQIWVHWVGDAISPSHPVLHPSVPALSVSQDQGLFPVSQLFESGGQSSGTLVSASVLPMNIQGLSFFRNDWLDLLAVQGTHKSLLQHHNSKASIPWHSKVWMSL